MTDPRSPYLFDVDLERFWADDAASQGKPFSTDKPQVPLGIHMPPTVIWDELGLSAPENAGVEVTNPYDVPLDLRKRYNDKAGRVIGRRVFPEDAPPPPDSKLPPVGGITDIFEAPRRTVAGTDWVMQAAQTPDELAALLDRVEKRDVRSAIVPDGWREEADRIRQTYGTEPRLGGGVRGPVTAAASIYGAERLVFLILDQPALARRFSELLADKIIEMTQVLYELSGTPDRRGFGFADDNCMLLNCAMYGQFGQPILRKVFETFAPDEGDTRYQHSDSSMGHLMPLLRDVGVNGVNFGPEVPAADIRRVMPGAVIHGQLSPWTFARGTDEDVAAEVLRDIGADGGAGGIVIATAGSINPGSRLSGLRAIMSTIQMHGRYLPPGDRQEPPATQPERRVGA